MHAVAVVLDLVQPAAAVGASLTRRVSKRSHGCNWRRLSIPGDFASAGAKCVAAVLGERHRKYKRGKRQQEYGNMLDSKYSSHDHFSEPWAGLPVDWIRIDTQELRPAARFNPLVFPRSDNFGI
jgi:hypothetical protein